MRSTPVDKKSFRRLPLIAIWLVLVASAGANATSVRVDYAFNITSSTHFPVPLAVTGTAFYDLTSPDLNGFSSVIGDYNLTSHVIAFNGVEASPAIPTFGQFTNKVSVQDQVPFTPLRDRFAIQSSTNYNLGGANIAFVTLLLEGPDSIFAGDDLFVLDPTPFSITRQGFVTYSYNGNFFANSTTLSSITVTPVPVPAAAWLFLSAIGGLMTLRRIRRMHCVVS